MSEQEKISEELKIRIAGHRVEQVGRPRHIWPKDIRAEVVAAYEGGISGVELQAQTGIAASLIHKWARKSVYKVKSKKVRSEQPRFSELKVVPGSIARDEFFIRLGPAEIGGFNGASSLVRFLREADLLKAAR